MTRWCRSAILDMLNDAGLAVTDCRRTCSPCRGSAAARGPHRHRWVSGLSSLQEPGAARPGRAERPVVAPAEEDAHEAGDMAAAVVAYAAGQDRRDLTAD